MAMTAEELLARIEKCNIRKEKIEKRILKWEQAKTEEKFIKERAPWESRDPKSIKTMEQLIQAHFNRLHSRYEDHTYEQSVEFINKEYQDYLTDCDREVRYAKNDLQDCLNTITNYQNRLQLLQEKENKPVIKIFKDFFENWKQEIIDWIIPKVNLYYDLNKKCCDLHNSRNLLIGPGKEFETKEEWSEAYKNLCAEERSVRNIPWVKIALDKGFRNETRRGDFDKYLNNYMNDRYDELVDKVTEKVGNITNVDMLKVGYDGSLNGIIVGDQGRAKVETIVAEGPIQCRHYRVLVHKLK